MFERLHRTVPVVILRAPTVDANSVGSLEEMEFMQRTRVWMIVPAALLLAACGPSINTSADWSPNVEWSSFYTFKWLPDAQGDGTSQATNQITDQRIKAAIDSVLTSVGLQKADSGSDLMVGYQVTTRTSVSYQTTGTTWGRSGWGRSGWGGGVTTMRTTPVYSQSGTLLISIFETSDKALVWHGSGSTDLQGVSDPQQRQQRINQVVGKILDKFPPPN